MVNNFDHYQDLAEITARKKPEDTEVMRFSNFALGIAGESGEVADYIKKVCFHGHKLDKDKLNKELGDVLWYTSMLARLAGIPFSKIANDNIAKLKARYPEGFDMSRSQNRAEGDEN